ncbi:DUF317 domain-containing protein [Kitasatospora sp. NPDC003701]
MVPRRLAGPGQPGAVWSALIRRGWQSVDWLPEGAGLISPNYDLVLAAAERDDQAVWKITAHPDTPLSPARWSTSLTRNTPAEILVDTLAHLTNMRGRDRRAALEGPHDLQGLFASAARAGWEETLIDGWAHLQSPDFGPEQVAIWHHIADGWAPGPDGQSATDIVVGGHTFEDAEAHVWRAEFSRRAPAHLVAAVLKAALSPKPVSRRPDEIPSLYRSAITTAATAPTEDPRPPGSPAPDDPAAACTPIYDWDFTDDELGNHQFNSPCHRVTVLDTPEDRHDVAWTSRWSITAAGDKPIVWSGDATPLRWTAMFTTHTPPTVIAAVTSAVRATLEDLDTLEVLDDFETSPEPSFTPNRTYRPDPVPGSRDPDLAHARLRLQGWENSDRPRARASRIPGGDIELWSVSQTESSTLDVVPGPASWTLDGGSPPNLWTATFSPATPTTLVLAAAREAARLTEPGPSPPGSAPQLGLSAGRAQAARTRTTHRSPAAEPTEAAMSSTPTGRRHAL